MEITDVKFYPVNELKVQAYATVTFDDSFVIRDVKVMKGPDGELFVSMPQKKLRNGRYLDIAHPKNPETRAYIHTFILEAFLKQDGADCPGSAP